MKFNKIDLIALFVLLVVSYLSMSTFLTILLGSLTVSIVLSVVWVKVIKRGVVNLDRDKYENASLLTVAVFGWWIGYDIIRNYNRLPSNRILSEREIKNEFLKLKRNNKIDDIFR